jgi:hypothetical protein
MNHDIVDGAPAARFTGGLKDLIESGYGLDDSTVESEQAVAPGASKKSERWSTSQGGTELMEVWR